MMARRWAPPRTPNAASIRSRNPGESSAAPQSRRAERARWRPWIEHLIRRPDGLVLLLTPPFDHTPHDPGYIKGYVPGIRENGGQYTHAAVWTLIAFAAMGDGDKAASSFGC